MWRKHELGRKISNLIKFVEENDLINEVVTLVMEHEIKEEEKDMPNTDPWIHRSKGMSCNTCMWFVLKKPTEPNLAETENTVRRENGYVGRCRRHAPTMNGYPVVFELDWCGDHKLDENAV